MIKSLPLLFLAVFPLVAPAQQLLHVPNAAQHPAVFRKSTDALVRHSTTRDLPSVPVQASFLNQEALIGGTLYDIQTNASMQNRLIVSDDGSKAATWMISQSTNESYPDRGTGFNETSDGVWGQMPSARLESARTGWPSLVRLSDGTLHITTHSGGQNLMSLRKETGASSWTEAVIPNNTPEGLLWPRTVAGGPDGKTIHLLAITTPFDGLGGQEYQGMNGHPLYARSLDGGITWDKIDVIVPGLDSNSYYEIEGDTYTIVARDNIVAIIIFGMWGDIALYKSYDNGETWEKSLINDFPLDKYRVDQGYTTDDIPEDPFAPDSLAIYTSDGSGGAVIDANGLVHVTYADTYVLDNDLTDSSSNIYPGWSGISYWNETMLNPALVGSFIDYNNNDTIDLTFDALPRYGNGTATSMPVITTDDEAGVYIVYSMVAEAYFNELQGQNYRHLVAIKSLDGGQTWGPSYDLINPELSDPEVYDFIEAVFPSMATYVNDTLHIVYQQDFFPGYRSVDEDDPLAENFAAYTAVPLSMIPDASSVSTHDVANLAFNVFPNPVRDQLNIQLNEKTTDQVTVELFDVQGQQLSRTATVGSTIKLDTSPLNPGFYFLKVSTKNQLGYHTIIKTL